MENSEREMFLKLISDVRQNQVITSLDSEVTIYVEEYFYNLYFDRYGEKTHQNIETYYYSNINAIDKSKISIGEMSIIGEVNIKYIDLINYYFNDEMETIRDLSTQIDCIEFEGDSVADCIIVEWSYEKYVGYCRNIHELRYGYYNETESDLITGNEDRTYRHNLSVLVEATELVGLSDEEKIELILEKLSEYHWKWNIFQTRPSFKVIISTCLDLNNIEDVESEEEEEY